MTNILIRLFVKDYEMVSNQEVRGRYGIMVSCVGIICNFVLFLVKLLIGMTMMSVSITADAFNNLSDAASSVVSFFGTKLANRPADREHPFGHGRYEYIAALIVAFLVFQVGFSCLKTSFEKIIHPEAIGFSPILVGILCLSVLVKLWLALLNKKIGKRIHSTVMNATAMDAFGDVGITLATILSVVIAKITGLNLDGYMGLVVSVFVLIAGVGIVKETLEPLLGEAISEEEYNKITEFVESYEFILGSHDLIVHSYGPSKKMASIHAEISIESNLQEIHEVVDKIEREAFEELGIFLVIHMDPIETDNHEVLEIKQLIEKALIQYDANVSLHDFRLTRGSNSMNCIFDLVVPHEYTREKKEDILMYIKKELTSIDQKYHCIVHVEHSFIKTDEK